MPTFSSSTVHGLSADCYVNSGAVRVAGEIVVSVTQEVLDLTANDLGMYEPVKSLRRGDATTVSVPLADASGIPTLSGIVFPFATLNSTSGSPASGGLVLPVSVPGDDFLEEAVELRLVLRDGSATWVFPSAVVTEIGELNLSEEAQTVYPVTFRCYRSTVSGGQSTPFYIVSGSVTP